MERVLNIRLTALVACVTLGLSAATEFAFAVEEFARLIEARSGSGILTLVAAAVATILASILPWFCLSVYRSNTMIVVPRAALPWARASVLALIAAASPGLLESLTSSDAGTSGIVRTLLGGTSIAAYALLLVKLSRRTDGQPAGLGPTKTPAFLSLIVICLCGCYLALQWTITSYAYVSGEVARIAAANGATGLPPLWKTLLGTLPRSVVMIAPYVAPAAFYLTSRRSTAVSAMTRGVE